MTNIEFTEKSTNTTNIDFPEKCEKYLIIDDEIWSSTELNLLEKNVLIVVGMFKNRQGFFITANFLQTQLGISLGMIRKTINSLQDKVSPNLSDCSNIIQRTTGQVNGRPCYATLCIIIFGLCCT